MTLLHVSKAIFTILQNCQFKNGTNTVIDEHKKEVLDNINSFLKEYDSKYIDYTNVFRSTMYLSKDVQNKIDIIQKEIEQLEKTIKSLLIELIKEDL